MAPLTIPTTARLPSNLRVDASNTAVVKALNRLSRTSLLSLVLDWLSDSNQALCPPLLRGADDDEDEDMDSFYPAAGSLDELRDIYSDMQMGKGSRREVVDRIIEGDWREGLTLYQLAMADLQHLYDHPGSLKWTAFKIKRLKTPGTEAEAEADEQLDAESLTVPRFHPSTFEQNLQAEVLPDVKAHYTFDRSPGLPIHLLRIFILDSPYNTSLAVSSRVGGVEGAGAAATSFDASRTLYVAFPDASPHIYISRSQSSGLTTTNETKSLVSLLVAGIPKALSRPRERYTLLKTNLATKNLAAMLHLKGAGRTNAAGGGWGIYAEENRNDSPLNPLLPTPPLSEASSSPEDSNPGGPAAEKRRRQRFLHPEDAKRERDAKRARLVAQARFGNSALVDDGKGVERVDILMQDAFPDAPPPAAPAEPRSEEEEDAEAGGGGGRRKSQARRGGLEREFEQMRVTQGDDERAPVDVDAGQDGWKPEVRLTFHGPHVFAGLRQLVEAGVIDGERMPGWMTGEEGVTIGAVRQGRIRGHKGSGL